VCLRPHLCLRHTGPSHLRPRLRLLIFIVSLCATGIALAHAADAALQKKQRNSMPRQQKGVVPRALVELQQRLRAAEAARQSGDSQSVVQANRLVLATGLREMAQLRFLEDAFPQAAELYKRSLEFEDTSDSHVDLAITYLRMRQAREALSESEKATVGDPNNARAWNIKGKAWMMLKDYRKAAQNLSHSISLRGDVETAYSLATCLLALKEKDKAALVFRDVLQAMGERGSLHVLFGRAYRDMNYMADAKREFKRALEVDPKTPHAHYFLGLIRLIENEWAPLPEIKQEMTAELKYHPRDYLANYVLGVFSSNAKEYEISDRHLTISAQEQPNSPEPWLYLGLNQYSRGNMRAAEELLRKAIDLTGSDEARSHYQIRKAYIALGRILIQSGRKEEAAKWMAKARNVQQLGLVESQQTIAEVFSSKGVGMGAVMPYISPENEEPAIPIDQFTDPTAKLHVSDWARSKLSDEAKAIALRQEKQLRDILGSGYNDLGTAEARQGQYHQALAHFLEAERWNPEIPGLTRNLGLAAARVGDHPTTVRTLSKYVAANPDDNVARTLLGIAYYETEAYADAAKTIAALGDKALQNPGLAYPFAVSLTRSGRVQEAEKVLDKLEQQASSAENLLLLGQQWADAGNGTRALAALRRAQELDPNLRRAHYHAGLVYIREGRPADAAREFEAELARSPDDTDAKYHLGYAYLLLSEREQASSMFQAVIASNPAHAEAQYQLGKLLLDEEKVKEAVAHLEAAARLSPEKDFVHYQLQAAYRKDGRIADADRELALYREIKARNREKTLPVSNQN
jgi:tetratricopeptide (TPR) repeat protein